MGRVWWIAIALPLLAQDRAAVNLYSPEKEAALGRRLAAEAARNTRPVDSAAVRDYVNALGQRLAATLPATGFPYTFTVISSGADNATHEPLALPGGYVFVPATLLLSARDEAEFAGMLAHGMAHIAARHFTRQATRGQLVNMSTVPLIYLGGWTGQSQNQGAALPLGLIRFQRANELEADRLAADAMAAAGFDPAALARYIERVQPEDGPRPWVFSPLPARDERVEALAEAVRAMPAHAYAAGDDFSTMVEEVPRSMPPARAVRPPSLRR